MTDKSLEPTYPDVLGAITGGTRFTMESLQCALGVFPRQAYINQPLEVVLILQSMVDQNMQVKVSLHPPTQDRKGNLVVMDTAKPVVSVGLQPGEVGVLRIPMVAHPPTLPDTDLPIHVAVRYRIPRPGKMIRPAAGGAPPSSLNISPFKLQALRDIEFVGQLWNESTDIITAYFDIAAKRLPPPKQTPDYQYETLWTPRELDTERQLVQSKIPEARKVAARLTQGAVFAPFLATVNERFNDAGIPLHPGEAKAVAKILTYTMTEAHKHESGYSLEGSRWFRALCQALAADTQVARAHEGDLVSRYLFEPAVHDAVLIGFRVVQSKVKENLGDKHERASYAAKVIEWLGGQRESDLSFVYLPLVLAGVALNFKMAQDAENPWVMLVELRRGYRNRSAEVAAEALPIFDLFQELLVEAENELIRAGIRQPA